MCKLGCAEAHLHLCVSSYSVIMAQTNDAPKVLKVKSWILKESIIWNLNKIAANLETTGVSVIELPIIINATEDSWSEYRLVREKLLGLLICSTEDETDGDPDVQEFCDAHDDYLIKIRVRTEFAKIEEQYSAPVNQNDASVDTVRTQQVSFKLPKLKIKHLMEREILYEEQSTDTNSYIWCKF